MNSFQNDVKNSAKCRIKSGSRRNRVDSKVSECQAKREGHGSTSNRSRPSKLSKESVAAKWNVLEKIFCTGEKMNAWTMEKVIQSGPLVPQNEYAQNEREIAFSIGPPIVVPNPSMDTLKYGDRYHDVSNPKRMLVKKYPNSRMDGTKQFWNQMKSSELEKDKLVLGSGEWMDAHLTAVLDKAKMTRELCEMR